MATKIHKKAEIQILKWKSKAIERGEELRKQKKRELELIVSREGHKAKWKEERRKRELIEMEMKAVTDSCKVRNHNYDLQTISVFLAVKNAGTLSLRSCRTIMVVMCLYFEIEMKIPCINTIRNWEYKCGLHRLEKRSNGEDEYVIIIDESFNIGRQSLLLVLGVNLSTYEFGSSLTHQNMEVLFMGVKPSWKADDIGPVIGSIKALNYRISYSCSDGGSNIVKALKDKEVSRIYDCTHALSLEVKKAYKNDGKFNEFLKEYALFNRQNYMGQDRLMCPPKLRGNSRFLNIYPIARWAEEWFQHLQDLEKKKRDETEERICKKLLWLKNYQALIAELVQVSKLLKSTFKILKNKGLNKATIESIEKIVEWTECPIFLRKGILNYLEANSILLSNYDNLICCSDVIESFFGKFKNNQKRNPQKGITIGCLDLINYGKPMDKKELKKALEETKIVDLNQWREKNNLQSFNNKRRTLVKKWG